MTPNIAALTKLLELVGSSDVYDEGSFRVFESKAMLMGLTPEDLVPAGTFLEAACNLEELAELAMDHIGEMMELFGDESFGELQLPDEWSDRESFDRTVFFQARVDEALESLHQLQTYRPGEATAKQPTRGVFLSYAIANQFDLEGEDLQADLERAYARFQGDHDLSPERTLSMFLSYAIANQDDLHDMLNKLKENQ